MQHLYFLLIILPDCLEQVSGGGGQINIFLGQEGQGEHQFRGFQVEELQLFRGRILEPRFDHEPESQPVGDEPQQGGIVGGGEFPAEGQLLFHQVIVDEFSHGLLLPQIHEGFLFQEVQVQGLTLFLFLQEYPAQGMVLGQDQQHPFFLDGFGDDLLGQLGNHGIHDGKVDPVVFQEYGQLADREFQQIDLHRRMVLQESRQDGGHQQGTPPGPDPDIQLLEFFVVQFGFQFFVQVMAAFQVMVIDLPSGGQLQGDLGTVEELTAQGSLQLGDVLAQAGLGDEQLFCSPGDVPFPGHHEKVFRCGVFIDHVPFPHFGAVLHWFILFLHKKTEK